MGTVVQFERPIAEDISPDDSVKDDEDTKFGDGDGIQIVIRIVSEEPELVVEEKPPSRAGAFIFGGLLGFFLGG